MPSSIGHGFAAAAAVTAFFPVERPRRLLTTAVLGAVLLDIDAVGRPFGFGDLAFLAGHRGFTHSLTFAVLLSVALVTAMFRGPGNREHRSRIMVCLALAFATHAALDAFTTYGDGVMLLAPFTAERFKSPWLPFRGIIPEVVAIWVPVMVLLAYLHRHRLPWRGPSGNT